MGLSGSIRVFEFDSALGDGSSSPKQSTSKHIIRCLQALQALQADVMNVMLLFGGYSYFDDGFGPQFEP